MPSRLSTIAFVIYVGLDLANPFIPGAFAFNPDECVEAVHCHGSRAPAAIPSANDSKPALTQASALRLARRTVREAGLRDQRSEPSQPLVIAHGGPPPPPSPSEDH
jgi:hypothetical protein